MLRRTARSHLNASLLPKFLPATFGDVRSSNWNVQSVVSELVTIMTVRVMHDHIMDVSTKWTFGHHDYLAHSFLKHCKMKVLCQKKIEALFEVSLWRLTLKVNCVHHKIWNISKWALKEMLLQVLEGHFLLVLLANLQESWHRRGLANAQAA